MSGYRCFRQRRGVALITALMLAAFLLVAAVGYLTVVDYNLHFQRRENLDARAYYLALSGLEYYPRFKVDVNPAFGPGSPPINLGLAAGEQITVWVETDGTIKSTGIIRDLGGNVLGRRTLCLQPVAGMNIASFANRLRIYDEKL